jgi:hypothetical protein
MLYNATSRLGDGYREILRPRVRGLFRAVLAARNTRVFLTETRVVADVCQKSLPNGSTVVSIPLHSGHTFLS